MKKLICTALALTMLATPMAAQAEGTTKSTVDMAAFVTMLDRMETIEAWRTELTDWFNVYYDRVKAGETLAESEMETVFSYAEMSVSMLGVYLWEAVVGTGGESENASDSIDKIESTLEMVKAAYNPSTCDHEDQENCMEVLSELFASIL